MGQINEIDLGTKWIKKIRNRLIYQNKNWLCIVCGETGSSKSYSAISLANTISSNNITIKHNLVFNSINFLQKIANKEMKKGEILIFDESGVGMSAREWYTVQNKLLGSVLQTFRNMNIGVIFTVPNLSFIDIQARKLFHNYLETANIDYKEETAYIKVYNIQHNSRYDKTYFKHPKFKINDRKIAMSHIAVHKPPKQLTKDYEKAKSEYTENLNREALESLTNPQKKTGYRNISNFDEEKQIGQEIIKNKDKFLREYNKRKFIDSNIIQNEFQISQFKAKKIQKYVENTLSGTHT